MPPKKNAGLKGLAKNANHTDGDWSDWHQAKKSSSDEEQGTKVRGFVGNSALLVSGEAGDAMSKKEKRKEAKEARVKGKLAKGGRKKKDAGAKLGDGKFPELVSSSSSSPSSPSSPPQPQPQTEVEAAGTGPGYSSSSVDMIESASAEEPAQPEPLSTCMGATTDTTLDNSSSTMDPSATPVIMGLHTAGELQIMAEAQSGANTDDQAAGPAPDAFRNGIEGTTVNDSISVNEENPVNGEMQNEAKVNALAFPETRFQRKTMDSFLLSFSGIRVHYAVGTTEDS